MTEDNQINRITDPKKSLIENIQSNLTEEDFISDAKFNQVCEELDQDPDDAIDELASSTNPVFTRRMGGAGWWVKEGQSE